MATFTLNLGKYNAIYKDKIKKSFNESTKLLKEYAEVISPEDTKKFVKNHKEIPASIEGDKVTASLENDTEYAIYLEYGVSGKQFNYHKGPAGGPRQIIYTGVGNRTFSRTLDNNQQEIINKVKVGLTK